MFATAASAVRTVRPVQGAPEAQAQASSRASSVAANVCLVDSKTPEQRLDLEWGLKSDAKSCKQ